MKNVIIVHGISETKQEFLNSNVSPANSHWFPWLCSQLIKNGISVQTPEMPDPYLPDMNYNKWSDVFSKLEINKETVLIGHSAGGGFLLKYLSIHKNIEINRLILVAPWLDVEKSHTDFFEKFDFDTNLVNRCGQIDLFYSTDDDDYILTSVNKITDNYKNINVNKFSDKGHFCKEDIGIEFPEVLGNVLL